MPVTLCLSPWTVNRNRVGQNTFHPIAFSGLAHNHPTNGPSGIPSAERDVCSRLHPSGHFMSQRLSVLLSTHEASILIAWVQNQQAALPDKGAEAGQREAAIQFLAALRAGLAEGDSTDVESDEWTRMRDLLTICRARTQSGTTRPRRPRLSFSRSRSRCSTCCAAR